MAIDPARAQLVTKEYRYSIKDDFSIKARFPNAREIVLDTALDETGGTALANSTFAATAPYARSFEVTIDDVLFLEDFTTSPNRYTVRFAKHPAANYQPSFDFTGGSLPSGATFARASAGRYFDASGSLASASSNTPRFDYHPFTLARRGILIEPAATNLFLNSDAANGAAWTANGMTTPSAFNMQETATSGFHNIDQQVTVTAQTYTISCFMRNTSGSPFRYFGIGAPGGAGSAGLDLTNGTVSGVSGSLSNATIEPTLSGSRYLITVQWTTTAQTGRLQFGGSTAATPFSAYLGSTSAGFDPGGFQLEAGNKRTSPITTTSSTVTRAADVLTLNWGSLGVPDGTTTLTYTFDDGSTQDVSTSITSGLAVVPTNLNRPWIKTVAVAPPIYTLTGAKIDYSKGRTVLTIRG